eukprot:1156223-Pelagomonas_calceolata.AAC.3
MHHPVKGRQLPMTSGQTVLHAQHCARTEVSNSNQSCWQRPGASAVELQHGAMMAMMAGLLAS